LSPGVPDGKEPYGSFKKYGKVTVAKIPKDDPPFILRAQDKLALPIIERYRVLAAFHESGVAPALQSEIGAFRTWKGLKKSPIEKEGDP
jgi:hypothetical protein